MEVKGIALTVFRPFITEKFGETGYQQWLRTLEPESRAFFEAPVGGDSWYPALSAYIRPTDILCQLFYEGDPRGAWEVGRYSAECAFSQAFRSVVKLTTLRDFISRLHLIAYYRPVTVRSVSTEMGRIVYRITEFTGISERVEHRIAGWNQRALEIHGCREVSVEIPSSLARGDPYTEFVITWEG